MSKTVKVVAPEGYVVDKGKSTFEEIVFKKIEEKHPRSWEGLRRVTGAKLDYYGNVNRFNNVVRADNMARNIFSTVEIADAARAVAQLSQLRDNMRDGWEPNWEDSN